MLSFSRFVKAVTVTSITLSCSMNLVAKEVLVGKYYYEFNGDEAIVMRPASLDEKKYVIPEKITYSDLDFKVTAIGGYKAFMGSSAVTVKLPNTIKSIAPLSFADCKRLKNFEIPSSVESLSWRVFSGCDNLECIIIPSSVEHIGWGAFRGCRKLNTVICLSESVKFGVDVFEDCDLLRTIVYAGIKAPDNWFAALQTYVPNRAEYVLSQKNVGKEKIIDLVTWHRTTYKFKDEGAIDLNCACNLKGYSAKVSGQLRRRLETGKWCELIPMIFTNGKVTFTIQIPYNYVVVPA